MMSRFWSVVLVGGSLAWLRKRSRQHSPPIIYGHAPSGGSLSCLLSTGLWSKAWRRGGIQVLGGWLCSCFCVHLSDDNRSAFSPICEASVGFVV